MKAIFEFDAPESCEECPYCGCDAENYELCILMDGKLLPLDENEYGDRKSDIGRAPFCPLEIVSDDAPTVDAVPVVRCEQCVSLEYNAKYSILGVQIFEPYWCHELDRNVCTIGFCGYGAKMEEQNPAE